MTMTATAGNRDHIEHRFIAGAQVAPSLASLRRPSDATRGPDARLRATLGRRHPVTAHFTPGGTPWLT